MYERHTRIQLAALICATVMGFFASGRSWAQSADPRAYDIGDPGPFVDLYVSSAGSDDNVGTTREQPLATLGAAWSRMTEFLSTGYRVNVLPGDLPCEGDCLNYFADRHGSREHPIVLRAFDGPGSATLTGGLNLANVSYLYLIDLTLKAGGTAPVATSNVLHIEHGDHILLRGLTLIGPNPTENPNNYDIQEVVRASQCEDLYLESCDIGGSYQTGVDFSSVQRGHIVANRIHDIGGWGMYLKEGSAYFRVEGNEFFDVARGFQAGGSSNFELMRSPWLHYEAYDIKFIDNLLHDIPGAPIGVAGGFNILIANNTLYRIAYDDQTGDGLLRLVHGGRVCVETAENGDQNADSICGDFLSQGGWGVTSQTEGGEWIPNRDIFIFNNLFYNPEPLHTRYSHFAVNSAVKPPDGSNVPDPSHTDDNIRMRGNLVWNGPQAQLLLLGSTNGGESGCDGNNAYCNEMQIRDENTINAFEPELVDPAGGNFLPTQGGNLFTAKVYGLSDFSWKDAPDRPAVPTGALSNGVTLDFRGYSRPAADVPGAFTTLTSPATAPEIPALLAPFDAETGISIAPVVQWAAASGAGSYRLQVSTVSTFTTLLVDEPALSATAYTIPDLNTGHIYYWRVRARNSIGESGWSPAWSFTTLGSVMTAPILVSPIDGTTDVKFSETLVWDAAPQALTYVVQVADDSTFALPLIRRTGIPGTTTAVAGIENKKVYYWRVRAVNGLGVSDWSEVWSFSSALSGVESSEGLRALDFSVYPNPTAGSASVEFTLRRADHVRLTVVDPLGRSVGTIADREFDAGEHLVSFDGSGYPSGVYTYVLETVEGKISRRILLVR